MAKTEAQKSKKRGDGAARSAARRQRRVPDPDGINVFYSAMEAQVKADALTAAGTPHETKELWTGHWIVIPTAVAGPSRAGRNRNRRDEFVTGAKEKIQFKPSVNTLTPYFWGAIGVGVLAVAGIGATLYFTRNVP